MKFLRQKEGTTVVEWLVAAFLVVAVVGSIVYGIARTTAGQGGKTDRWIGSIPDPSP